MLFCNDKAFFCTLCMQDLGTIRLQAQFSSVTTGSRSMTGTFTQRLCSSFWWRSSHSLKGERARSWHRSLRFRPL